ncbi:MAG: diaminopimelate decarboxylase [Patescibacteria group bacterium]
MDHIDRLNFLSEAQVRQLAQKGTPVFVYSRAKLAANASRTLDFQAPYDLGVRFAMKANPHPEILRLFQDLGIGVDASSGYEADIAIAAGIKPSKIQITGQELPVNLSDLLKKGVKFTACSLHQLESYGKLAPGTDVGVRINPGTGDGMNNRLTTGGPAASFGIWHEYIDKVHEIAKKYRLTITLLHTHAGTGTEPEGWLKVAQKNLELLERFPDATTTSLGGGFKVGRMRDEKTADLQAISQPIADSLKAFAAKTGRKIRLEIEPGNFLVTNSGTLITSVIDTKDTGKDGYRFLIINGGMTEILRPSLYGAQHPLVVVTKTERKPTKPLDYAVAGHCCESGDMLTVASGDPETLSPRLLAPAEIGDYLCVEYVGAYCASMRASGYNSFPVTPEILID